MLRKKIQPVILSLCFFAAVLLQLNCANNEKKEMPKDDMIRRGAYLVNVGGCKHCHSPRIMTTMGLVPDTTKLLSGHMGNEVLPSVDANLIQQGKWFLLAGSTRTFWAGPWGVSFAANITPDEPTGIGTWTDEIFIKALRTGKHMGIGRPILPPMPWEDINQATDEDLKAIFTYLKSIPSVHNQVPDPVPPEKLSTLK